MIGAAKDVFIRSTRVTLVVLHEPRSNGRCRYYMVDDGDVVKLASLMMRVSITPPAPLMRGTQKRRTIIVLSYASTGAAYTHSA